MLDDKCRIVRIKSKTRYYLGIIPDRFFLRSKRIVYRRPIGRTIRHKIFFRRIKIRYLITYIRNINSRVWKERRKRRIQNVSRDLDLKFWKFENWFLSRLKLWILKLWIDANYILFYPRCCYVTRYNWHDAKQTPITVYGEEIAV